MFQGSGSRHAAAANFTDHARRRLEERGIPACLVRLALEKGSCVEWIGKTRFVLDVSQIVAAGHRRPPASVGVVVVADRIITVFWI